MIKVVYMSSYNYSALKSEILEDIENGILSEDDMLYIIRKTTPIFDDYRPILDYEYDDILDGPCEAMRVSWVLKEMDDMNLDG